MLAGLYTNELSLSVQSKTLAGLYINELSLSVQSKTLAGLYTREWAFLVLSFINITAAVSLTLVRMVQVLEDDPKSSDFTFTILLLINAGTVTMATYRIHIIHLTVTILLLINAGTFIMAIHRIYI